MNTSPTKLYDAVSDPQHLINWWPLKCSGEPKIDNVYNLNFTDKYDWYAKVIKADKDKSFHLKMQKSDPDWDPTSFGFDIEERPNGVLLRFAHYNWPDCNDHFKHSSFCWALLLNALKQYLEKGEIIPFEQRA